MFDFQEELRKLPDQPGVYIMHDKTDAIIYIGKAVSLRKRVRQYFQPFDIVLYGRACSQQHNRDMASVEIRLDPFTKFRTGHTRHDDIA